MNHFGDFSSDTHSKGSPTTVSSVDHQEKELNLLQQVFLIAGLALTIIVGVVSILVYLSLHRLTPVNDQTNTATKHTLSTLLFLVSTKIAPTYGAILVAIKYLCTIIATGAFSLLYMLYIYWADITVSTSIYYQVGRTFVTGLIFFSATILLTMISSPQLQGITVFPNSIYTQVLAMIVSIIGVAIVPFLLYVLEK